TSGGPLPDPAPSRMLLLPARSRRHSMTTPFRSTAFPLLRWAKSCPLLEARSRSRRLLPLWVTTSRFSYHRPCPLWVKSGPLGQTRRRRLRFFRRWTVGLQPQRRRYGFSVRNRSHGALPIGTCDIVAHARHFTPLCIGDI